MIKLIALLGNVGKQYSGTRHNAAWIFAESLSVYSSLNWQKKFKANERANKNMDKFYIDCKIRDKDWRVDDGREEN